MTKYIHGLAVALVTLVPNITTAQEGSYMMSGERSGYYVGLEYGNKSKIELTEDTSDASTIKVDVDPYIGLVGGLNTRINDSFYIGYELAYYNYGNGEIRSDHAGSVVEVDDSDALSINVKPKYYFQNSNFYISGLAGLGVYSSRITVTELMVSSSNRDSDTAVGFLVGAEAGYELDNRIGLVLGYKKSYFQHDYMTFDLDTEIGTPYIGVNYRF